MTLNIFMLYIYTFILLFNEKLFLIFDIVDNFSNLDEIRISRKL